MFRASPWSCAALVSSWFVAACSGAQDSRTAQDSLPAVSQSESSSQKQEDVSAASSDSSTVVSGEGEAQAALPRVYEPAGAHREFAAQLHRVLASGKGNLAHSPLSTEQVLAMIYAGALGETAEQLGRAAFQEGSPEVVLSALKARLQSLQSVPPEITLLLAQAVFVDKTQALLPEYKSALQENFSASLELLDLSQARSSLQTMNSWVERVTRGAIRQAVPDSALTAQERSALFLVNALYFKGNWQKRFPRAATHSAPFTLSSGEEVQVPTMHQTLKALYRQVPAEGAHPAAQVLELSYSHPEVRMQLILPSEDSSLSELETSLDGARLEQLTSSLSSQEVSLFLPRFSFSSAAPRSLQATLRTSGVSDLFDPSRAELTGIAAEGTNGARLFVSDIYQSVYLRVDEEGTVAAAATTGKLSLSSQKIPQPPLELRLDRPFLLLLRHLPTGTIVMMGRVSDPRSSVG